MISMFAKATAKFHFTNSAFVSKRNGLNKIYLLAKTGLKPSPKANRLNLIIKEPWGLNFQPSSRCGTIFPGIFSLLLFYHFSSEKNLESTLSFCEGQQDWGCHNTATCCSNQSCAGEGFTPIPDLSGIHKEPHLCLAMPSPTQLTFALALELSSLYVIERELMPDGSGWRLVCFDKDSQVLININMGEENTVTDAATAYSQRFRTHEGAKEDIDLEAETCFQNPRIVAYTQAAENDFKGSGVKKESDASCAKKKDLHVTLVAREGPISLSIQLSKLNFDETRDSKAIKHLLGAFQLHQSYKLSPKEHLALGTLLFHGNRRETARHLPIDRNDKGKSEERPVYDDTSQDQGHIASSCEVSPQLTRSLRHFEHALQEVNGVNEGQNLNTKEIQSAINHIGLLLVLHGKHKEAIERYTKGIQQFPEYPNFSYNIACVYAELKQEEEMFYHLRKALVFAGKKKKETGISTKLTNPAKDLSFANYWGNPSFQQLVNEHYYINVYNDVDVI